MKKKNLVILLVIFATLLLTGCPPSHMPKPCEHDNYLYGKWKGTTDVSDEILDENSSSSYGEYMELPQLPLVIYVEFTEDMVYVSVDPVSVENIIDMETEAKVKAVEKDVQSAAERCGVTLEEYARNAGYASAEEYLSVKCNPEEIRKNLTEYYSDIFVEAIEVDAEYVYHCYCENMLDNIYGSFTILPAEEDERYCRYEITDERLAFEYELEKMTLNFECERVEE